MFSDFYLQNQQQYKPYNPQTNVIQSTGSHNSPEQQGYTTLNDGRKQCSQCGKVYSLKHNLVRHMTYECGGQKKFSCHLCSNKYTQNASLTRHLVHAHNMNISRTVRYCRYID